MSALRTPLRGRRLRELLLRGLLSEEADRIGIRLERTDDEGALVFHLLVTGRKLATP